MALTTVTITGQFKNADNTNPTGEVEFVVSHRSKATAENLLIPTTPVVAKLTNGAFSVVLFATDQTGIDPTNLTYKVTERVDGSPEHKYNIEVPVASGGGTLDLADIAPVAIAVVSPTTYALQSTVTGHISDTVDAHDATAVSRSATSWLTETNVGDALDHIDSARGAANGLADLDANGKLPTDRLSIRIWNITDHVAADAIELDDVRMTAGSAVIDCATANFTAADIGKQVAVTGVGSGGAALTTSNNPIVAVNSSTQIVATKTAVVSTVAPRTVADGAMTRNSQDLTSATAVFTAGDVGKSVTVVGAGESDRRIVSEHGGMTSGSAVLTATYAAFTASIVGKRVRVSGAGVGGAPLVATVLSRASATSITLDTAASTTMTRAVVESWTIADLVTTITRYVNATTVKVRNPATQTVSGASVSIGGHKAVYGTNDVTAFNNLLGLASDGDTLVLKRNRIVLLGQDTFTINKAVTIRGEDPETSIIHWGATSGRISASSDRVNFERMGFKALPLSAQVKFFLNKTSGTPTKKWRFKRCISDGVALVFELVGALANDGTTLTSGSNFSGDIGLDDCEVRHVMADSAVAFRGIDGARVNKCWFHHNGTDLLEGDQVKVSYGSKSVHITGGIIEWGARDAIDIYDADAAVVQRVTMRHNTVYGLDAKWISNQHYNATTRHSVSFVTAWNNRSGGIHATAPMSKFSNIVCIANGGSGLRTGSATNDASVPTEAVIISGLTAIGNTTEGLLISQGTTGLTVTGAQLYGNQRGASIDAKRSSLSGIQSFGNANAGTVIEAASSRIQLSGAYSQDSNGSCSITAGASFISVNGYGEEAAGSGNQPTLASWPVGVLVHNTSDSTSWRRLMSSWERIAEASTSTFPPMTVSPNHGATSITISANTTRFYRVERGIGSVGKIALEVVTSSGQIGVAVYANEGFGRAAKPTGAPLATSGMVACPAAGYAEIALNTTVFVRPGDWIAYSTDNTTVSIRAATGAPTITALSDGFSWAHTGNLPTPSTFTSITGRLPVLLGIPA